MDIYKITDSEFKLESKTGELRNNTAFIDAMTEDWNRFLSVVQTDKARKAVIDAMNAGSVRLLFGSTSMLGTGVNAQKRCVAIHNLITCPNSAAVTLLQVGRSPRRIEMMNCHVTTNRYNKIIISWF